MASHLGEKQRFEIILMFCSLLQNGKIKLVSEIESVDNWKSYTVEMQISE